MHNKKRKISFGEYFWTFLICSILGTFYEEICHIIKYFFKYHEFNWSRRSGLLWGPINPVYGFSSVFLVYFLGKKERSKTKVYLSASLLSGFLEYMASLIQELLTGTTSWDYSGKFLNIQGRTTVIYMLVWGLFGLILIKWLFPKICHIIEMIPKKTYNVLTTSLFVLVLIDIIISWSALARMEMREKGIEPHTFIGKFYDEHFTDDYIHRKFPNMKNT